MMTMGIGIPLYFVGLFCTSEAAAIKVAKEEVIPANCSVTPSALSVMPQQVVFRNGDMRVVRMGIELKPGSWSNVWVLTNERVVGE
jgi:hypothetical protein